MLWLSYRVAMSEGNSEVALDILRKLLHLDPYNQAALASMAEMYAKLEQWDKVREPAQKLLSSKRHVNHKLVEEMRAYVAQASSVK
jgi:Tfp pilus assembly protein PilF